VKITLKTKNTLKSTYKAVKKSINSFLKKLGLKHNDTIKLEKNIEKKIKEEILRFEREHQKLKELLDVIIPENKANENSLRDETFDDLSPETIKFLTAKNNQSKQLVNHEINNVQAQKQDQAQKLNKLNLGLNEALQKIDKKEQTLVTKIKKKVRFSPTNTTIFFDKKKGTIAKLETIAPNEKDDESYER